MESGSAISIALLLLLLLLGLPVSIVGGVCGSELLDLSPCLPYVASWPNNRSSSETIQCCVPLLASANNNSSGNGSEEACLCTVLRHPFLLGFPVNTTRLISLLSLCHLSEAKPPEFYLHSLCQGSPTYPPVQSPKGNPTSPPARSPTDTPTFRPVQSSTASTALPPPHDQNINSTSPPQGSCTDSKPPPPSKNSSVINSSCGFSTYFTMLFLVFLVTIIVTLA